jgi:hypothetical protein
MAGFNELMSISQRIASTCAPTTAKAKGLQKSFTVQRQIRIALLIAFYLGLSGAIAGAQQFSSAATNPSTAPTPVPLSQIAPQAKSTLRIVNSIETALSNDPMIATVQRRLPSLTTEIDLRGAEMDKFLVGIVPLELLHSMEIVLQRYGDQLSNWNQDLTARIGALDNQITQLDGLSKIWKATLQLPELSQHVIDVLKRVAANQSGVTKEPAPQAYVVNLASAAVSYNLRAWTEQYGNWILVRSDLSVAVDEALVRESIPVA